MNNPIGIKHISSCVADKAINITELAHRFDLKTSFIETKTGFTQLYQLSEQQDVIDLIQKNIEIFKQEALNDFSQIGLIVCVTQNSGKISMPHISALIQKLICPSRSIPTFDISLGCSGWVYAIEVIRSFMESMNISDALLITCDPYSQIINEDDKNTSLLFSDGSSVTWLSSLPDCEWHIGKGIYGTDGSRYQAIYRQKQSKLQMNGRALFEAVIKTIPNVIKDTINKNGFNLKKIDKYVIHQGSRYLVDYLAQEMDLGSKMPFSANLIGNTVSSSIPSVFNKIVHHSDEIICVCGFGIGFSWGCNILTRNKRRQK